MVIDNTIAVEIKTIDQLNNLSVKQLAKISSIVWKYQKRVDAVLRLQEELDKEEKENEQN